MHKKEIHKWWRILFGILLIFFVLDIVGLPFEDNLTFSDAIWLTISGLSLIPVYGYAYQVAIGSKLIAIIILMFNLPALMFGMYLSTILFANFESVVQLFLFVLGLVAVGVIIYPMYRYAFQSDHLWNENA